jgi:carbamate kinase
MTSKQEVRIVERALNRLTSDGYQVVLASDGGTRYKVNHAQEALEAASGADEACFFLEKAEHHCTLFIVWGNGEDVICDYSADSNAELDRIEELIYG